MLISSSQRFQGVRSQNLSKPSAAPAQTEAAAAPGDSFTFVEPPPAGYNPSAPGAMKFQATVGAALAGGLVGGLSGLAGGAGGAVGGALAMGAFGTASWLSTGFAEDTMGSKAWTALGTGAGVILGTVVGAAGGNPVAAALLGVAGAVGAGTLASGMFE